MELSVPASPRDLRWSEEARLRAIDAMAFWEGRVNRADLMRRFGISVPQATNDLREYQARAPGNLRYDTRGRAYVSAPAFQPLFGAPSAESWLAENEAAPSANMPVASIPLPMRRIDPWLLRRMLFAHRNGLALRVLYQPMDVPDARWRWISAVSLGSDGLRWHLRAFNHDAGRHEDMLFPRIMEIDGERPAGAIPADEDWDRTVLIRLRPADRLSEGQRRVIEADYGMQEGEARIEVRAALLFLFLRRLGLDREGASVTVANRDEVDAALAMVRSRFDDSPL